MIASRSVVNELSAYGVARATIAGAPLSEEELRKTHAFWSACNYLALGMIYLQGNPLLRECLKREHIKNRMLGHWGASPALSFIYTHLNRAIRSFDLDMTLHGRAGTRRAGRPGLVEWVREAMLSFETPLINAEDVQIPVCVADSAEAIAIIRSHKDARAAVQTA